MIELTTLQRQILLALLFPEPFDTLVEEIQATQPVIASELKWLIAKGLVVPMAEDQSGRFKQSLYYDSDNMRAFRYQITAKGLKQQEG